MASGNFRRTAFSSHKRTVWIFVLATVTLTGILFGIRIYFDYARTLQNAEERLITQTKVVDENITTNLTVVNLMLNSIVKELAEPAAKKQLNRFLKQQLVMAPGIRTLMVNDQAGLCIYSNRDDLLGKDFSKRDYFTVPRDAPDKSRLFLSPPYTSLAGKYVINITRPLVGTKGEFNGIVTITLDPAYFSALLSSTLYSPDNRVTLVHSDGTIFIAMPEAKIPVTGLKVTQPGSAFLQHLAGGSAVSIRRASGKTIGDKRIFAYCTNIPKGLAFDRQIVIAASRSESAVFAGWRMDAAVESCVFVLFAALFIIFTRIVLLRQGDLKRLEETQALMAAIVEYSDDAILSKDLDGNILSWNTAAERLFLYHPEEVIGQPVSILIPSERQLEEDRIMQQLKAGEPVDHFETVRVGKDGRHIQVSVTSSPIMDNDGMIVGASKIIRDITEQKRAEEALRQRETELQISNSELQTANEELDMQSEELQAQSEELQMQSEELSAHNEELTVLWEKAKQDEASLRASEGLLRAITDTIPDPIFMKDRDCRLMLANPATLAVLNRRADEVIGKTDEEIYDDPAIGRLMMANDGKVMASGQPQIIEEQVPGPNGLRTFLSTKAPYRDPSGRVIGIIGVARDISERKQAEEILQSSHDKLETLVKDRTADVLRLNRLYLTLSETNKAIVRAADRDSLFRDFCRIAVEQGGFLLSWVGLLDEKSGEVRIAASCGVTDYLDDIRISVVKGPECEGPTGISIRTGSYCVCNDFQSNPITAPWHERGRVHGIHASASIALKEEGRVIGALTLYSGEGNFFDRQNVELFIQMGTDVSFALDNFAREARRRDMERILIEETAERLRTAESLREKEQMLLQQSRQAAMGEMINNIAHQWRQPLNTLGLLIQRVGFFHGSPGFTKEFLDTTVAKSMDIVQYMSKTIDDFRNYFRPDKEKKPFVVKEAIDNTLSLLEGSLQNPKIAIEVVTHDNPVIYGYPNEFSQVLLNLLVNSRDAIIEREIEHGRVAIMVCSEDGCAVITVMDNAGGIPDEIIGKVFDPYFTTKGPQQGTGIGLFMSKTIIEKNMGGSLEVRNVADGAEFRIEVQKQ